MYNCPNCSTPFELGTKYCSKCGISLGTNFTVDPICPICFKHYPAGSTFCSTDGTKLVSADKLIPKCVICGTQYPTGTKYCPKDGGAVIAEALRYSIEKNNYQGPTHLEKASIGNRLVALILDSLISFLFCIPSAIFWILALTTLDYTDDAGLTILYFALAALFGIIPMAYIFIKDGLGEGQSWGKKIMNIKVVKVSDCSNCTKGTSALRTIIGWLVELIPLVGPIIEPILVLANSEGIRLADRAAGTMVINKIKS